jgi:hypothetical protein
MADTPPLSSLTDRSSAQVTGLQAVMNDASVKAILSDPGKLAGESLKSGLEAAAGTALSAIKPELTKALAPILSDVFGSALGDISQAIPVAGAMVGMVFKIVDGLAHMDEINKQSQNELCSQLQQQWAPTGSGSFLAEGSVVPADLFAPIHRIYDTWPPDRRGRYDAMSRDQRLSHDTANTGDNPLTSGPVFGVEWYASTIGQALMLITEGLNVDSGDVDFAGLQSQPWVGQWITSGDYYPKIIAAYRPGQGTGRFPVALPQWEWLVNHNLDYWDGQYRKEGAGDRTVKQLGPSPSRRAQFTALRRAIRAAYTPSGASSSATAPASDGGAAMWILYLDLLRDEWTKGHLPPEWMAYVLARRPRAFHAGPGTEIFGWDATYLPSTAVGMHTCAANTTNQLLGLIQQWDAAANPRYAAGQQKIADIRAQAVQIAAQKGAAIRAAAGLPPVAAPSRLSSATSDAFARAVATVKAHPEAAAGAAALVLLGAVWAVRQRKRP